MAAPPPGWRDRLLPQTALGLSLLLFAASLGAAFSGAIFYAYYEFRTDEKEDAITGYVESFQEEVDAAREIVKQEAEDARQTIRNELEPLQRIAASGETLKQLLEDAAPSVWFVTTLDEAGQPSVGSAFVAFSDAEQTTLITSFNTVRAATRQPGPEVRVRKNGEEVTATLHTWDEARDLALLTIPRGGGERLEWGAADSVRPGDRVFVISGLGGSGGAISQGFVADVSAAGIQHDAPVGAAFQGGPLLNGNGEVVAIASRSYAPLGFDPLAVFFGVPVREACQQILRCPEGEATGAGEAGG
ncbi:MAG: trypsin-like peptidase domain-containing protein [Actinomycetota bacterium]